MAQVFPITLLILFYTTAVAGEQAPFVETEQEFERALKLDTKPKRHTTRSIRGPSRIVDDPGAEFAAVEEAPNDNARARVVVNFDSGSARIMPNSHATLDNLGRVLQRTDAKILVEGHTDSVGNEYYNQRLSEDRAQSIIDYLTRVHGIETDRLSMQAFGESRPLESNASEAGRAKNRRVEFVRVR